jgi:hypothetical protein
MTNLNKTQLALDVSIYVPEQMVRKKKVRLSVMKHPLDLSSSKLDQIKKMET